MTNDNVDNKNLFYAWPMEVVLRNSKMGRGEHCSRYMFLKLPKTITLVRKRWFFSKVLRIQDGQEYLSIKLFVMTISSYILHHTLQPCDHNIPISADDNKKWPWQSCMTNGSLLTLLSAIKIHTREGNCLLRHFFIIPVVFWWLIIQQYSIIFMAEIVE